MSWRIIDGVLEYRGTSESGEKTWDPGCRTSRAVLCAAERNALEGWEEVLARSQTSNPSKVSLDVGSAPTSPSSPPPMPPLLPSNISRWQRGSLSLSITRCHAGRSQRSKAAQLPAAIPWQPFLCILSSLFLKCV